MKRGGKADTASVVLLGLVAGPSAAVGLLVWVLRSRSLALTEVVVVVASGIFGFVVAGAAGWRGAKQQVVGLGASLVAFVAATAISLLFFWNAMHSW